MRNFDSGQLKMFWSTFHLLIIRKLTLTELQSVPLYMGGTLTKLAFILDRGLHTVLNSSDLGQSEISDV